MNLEKMNELNDKINMAPAHAIDSMYSYDVVSHQGKEVYQGRFSVTFDRMYVQEEHMKALGVFFNECDPGTIKDLLDVVTHSSFAMEQNNDYVEKMTDGVLKPQIVDEVTNVTLALASSLKFPSELRKMWSGGEVQDWIDEKLTEFKQIILAEKFGINPADIKKLTKEEIEAI